MTSITRADADAKLAALGFVIIDEAKPIDAPVIAAPAVDVRERLDASIAAHAAYQQALRQLDRTEARAQLQKALDARVAAQQADPTFTDAAWADLEGLHPHTALVLFYRQELAKP